MLFLFFYSIFFYSILFYSMQVVDMAKAPLRPKHHKKGGATPLTRPLVCICNDPFAPHLRPLREVQ
jgi:hypothetical protein